MYDWSDDCPSREPGLTHAHWQDCDPSETHPGTATTHQYNQCCHCESLIAPANRQGPGIIHGYQPQQTSQPPVPAVAKVEDSGPPADHDYMPTLGGRCARHGCGRPQVAHPALKPVAERQEGVCSVNHASISIKALIADGGWEWTRCPSCGVQLEPALPEEASPAALRVRRQKGGRGLMPFTKRHLDELDRLARAWIGGYLKS